MERSEMARVKSTDIAEQAAGSIRTSWWQATKPIAIVRHNPKARAQTPKRPGKFFPAAANMEAISS